MKSPRIGSHLFHFVAMLIFSFSITVTPSQLEGAKPRPYGHRATVPTQGGGRREVYHRQPNGAVTKGGLSNTFNKKAREMGFRPTFNKKSMEGPSARSVTTRNIQATAKSKNREVNNRGMVFGKKVQSKEGIRQAVYHPIHGAGVRQINYRAREVRDSWKNGRRDTYYSIKTNKELRKFEAPSAKTNRTWATNATKSLTRRDFGRAAAKR